MELGKISRKETDGMQEEKDAGVILLLGLSREQ